MKRSILRLCLLAASLTGALALTGVGTAGAAAPLCAYPISSSVAGTTVTDTFSVSSDPACIPTGLPSEISLVAISYAGGTATIVDSATVTFAPGIHSLSVDIPCGVNTEVDLIYGLPRLFPPPPYDIHATAYYVPCTAAGTATIGYWKNHPDAWPVQSVALGAGTVTKAQALAILGMPPRGDATRILAVQLIAAQLNVAAGNASSCIAATVAQANALLVTYPVGSNLRTSTAAGAAAVALGATLDQYNNGLLCAPHRDA
jgi:hypothetical protein